MSILKKETEEDLEVYEENAINGNNDNRWTTDYLDLEDIQQQQTDDIFSQSQECEAVKFECFYCVAMDKMSVNRGNVTGHDSDLSFNKAYENANNSYFDCYEKLKTHLAQDHIGSVPYKCPHCNKFGSDANVLFKHCELVHPNNGVGVLSNFDEKTRSTLDAMINKCLKLSKKTERKMFNVGEPFQINNQSGNNMFPSTLKEDCRGVSVMSKILTSAPITSSNHYSSSSEVANNLQSKSNRNIEKRPKKSATNEEMEAASTGSTACCSSWQINGIAKMTQSQSKKFSALFAESQIKRATKSKTEDMKKTRKPTENLQCRLCGKSVKNYNCSLTFHIRMHHLKMDKSLKCSKCDFLTNDRSVFTYHKRKSHHVTEEVKLVDLWDNRQIERPLLMEACFGLKSPNIPK